MELSKMTKAGLLARCNELKIIKCKSKNKKQLILLIEDKNKPDTLDCIQNIVVEMLNENLIENSIINTNVIHDVVLNENLIENSIINTDVIHNVVLNENIVEPDAKLIHGDCLIEMPKIQCNSVDLILCDLPYGITKNSWDIIIPFDQLWKEYDRIIKHNGAIILFGSQPFTSLMITSNLKNFRYCLVWEKNKFSDFLNAKRKPMKTNEDICIFYKKQPTYNPQYWYSTPYTRWNTQSAVDKQTNYGNHKKNHVESIDGKRLPTTVLKFNRIERPKHPTQKPVDLLEWIIKTYTNEGDKVLDNCMGVGSTGVACKNTKRNFIGIELNIEYFKIATERINI